MTAHLRTFEPSWPSLRRASETARTPPGELTAQPPPVCIQLNEKLKIGGPPTPLGLQTLAWEGFAAIIDIRAPGDRAALLAALLEADHVASAGLRYLSRPLSRSASHGDNLESLIADIEREPDRLYLHCEDGRAALMLGLMAMRCMRSAGELFARMAAWGAPMFDTRLRAQARTWFETHAFSPVYV